MKIRGPIFETNSSSAHTLIVPQRIPMNVKGGIPDEYKGKDVTLRTGEYGWGYEILEGWLDKAEYIATYAKDSGEDRVKEFCKKLKALLQAKSVKILKSGNPYHEYGYIDHESIGFAGCCYANMERVIFDPNVKIMLANDNEDYSPPKGWEGVRDADI